ncbi:peptidoglycan endopeptidase LytE [Bacillus sp. OV322]|uniref:C40 family peptidase n=1 Tax=Bacillus sp. OV322 TaxID=1882764 RepID=UPI0008E4ED7A|nr:C40 family peptidase [Bacillus sp. OV322]SFC23519.1 peptidoglycan endopeptidase LytE [Bacillus sp. OV322]
MNKGIVTLSAAAVISSAFASPALADTYIVKSGDSLSKIASAHHITVTKLKQMNKLTSDSLRINQKLTVPDNKITIKKANAVTYTVAKGDSLIKIANKYSLTLAELKKLNNLKTASIYIGQKLIISQTKQTTVLTLPKPANTEGKTESSAYLVKSGDSLWKIASQFKTSPQSIIDFNHLKTDALTVGQSLLIPKSGTAPAPAPPAEAKPNPLPAKDASSVIAMAKKMIGVPYSWAGASPDGFDCSGFIYYVFKNSGYQISRVSAATYYDLGKSVATPKPGDLVFFSTNPASSALISHMGIYIGNGQFIHASSSKGVQISSLSMSYYQTRFAGYRSL